MDHALHFASDDDWVVGHTTMIVSVIDK